MKLLFVINWNKKDKTKTWSGTSYSIYKALQKYFELQEEIIPDDKFLVKCIRKFFCVGKNFTSTAWNILRKRNALNKKCEGQIVFQFTEYVNNPSCKTYIYQDLNVEYLYMLSQDNKMLFEYSVGERNRTNYLLDRLKLQKEYYKSASGIFCMGKWFKEYLINECNVDADKVIHVGGGINIEITQPSKNKSNTKILFVGRDFKRKGGFITVDAFKILKTKLPNVELFVIGPRVNPINEEIAGYHYLGDLNFNEVSVYFRECDIFCMPSYFEAYGLVFIEALASGLPCIGRDCYEMPYFIDEGKTGLLLKNDSPEELASLMSELLINKKYKENVEAMKLWYISEYSWDSVAKRMYDFIEKRN